MPAESKSRDSGNRLLDLLPDGEFDALGPSLGRVELALRQVIHAFEAEVTHVYFPTTALVSLQTILEEDDPVEVATVGRDGFVGMTAALGVPASPHRGICQMAGESLVLPMGAFREALARGPALRSLVHLYIAYALRLASQGTACNALHPVEARAARWLLTAHDQAGRDDLPMTQEFLAFILGVRRQSVTVVAGTLQAAGLIKYRRGHIVVLDRPRLEEAACECYGVLGDYYRRVVG